MQRIGSVDKDRAYATLIAAAADDPTVRWMFPDDGDFYRVMPGFIEAVAGITFETGTAWQLDDFAAVALLWAPGVGPDFEGVSAVLRTEVDVAKQPDLFDYLAQADAGHPHYPHWSIATFGVEPARQTDGVADRLLTQCVAHVQTTGRPLYFACQDPRAVPFFEGHGFVVTSVVNAGAMPPLTLMLHGVSSAVD